MGTLNRVTLIGHLGADPELRYTQSGQPVANLRMATSEGSGERARTEWHQVVVWGKQAETCGEFLQKGRLVCIEGRLQTREWEDRTGTKRSAKEVVANQVTFLGTPRASADAEPDAGIEAGE